MLKRLFIKNKYGLTIASVVLLLICYQLAFKKTLEAWQLNSRLQLQINNASSLRYSPGYLDRQNSNLTKLLKAYTVDTLKFRSNIIDSVAMVAGQENVEVTAIPSAQLASPNEHLVMQQLELEGSYAALMKTAQKLYALQGIGLPQSVTIKAPQQNAGKKNSALLMEVYIAAIRQ